MSEFENSGIPVGVGAGSTTTFSAKQTDPSGTSECSNAVVYRQVNNPPAVPELTGVTPVSSSDNNFPRLLGSAEPESTVAIYADPSCSGAVLGSGPASEFSSGGVVVNVADNSTTTFYARATWAELPSGCSSTSITYQEVTPIGSPPPPSPPTSGGGQEGGQSVGPARPAAPKIHTLPGARANSSTPLIVGSAVDAASVEIFKNAACTGRPVASGSAGQLGAGFAVAVAENVITRFYARSTDAKGAVSDCSDQALYTEDSIPPLTRVTYGPAAKTRKKVSVFRFADVSDDPPGTTFSCKLDKRKWEPCQAPLRLSHLKPKAHVLRIRATDAAGNREPVGAVRRFKVIRSHH